MVQQGNILSHFPFWFVVVVHFDNILILLNTFYGQMAFSGVLSYLVIRLKENDTELLQIVKKAGKIIL